MSFLHSHQIIHSDLNPSNILEDDHLYTQIIKFSLAQIGDNKPTISHFARNIFDKKPIYMAPELFNKNSVSFETDVYSFSFVVYEILTNEIPYEKLEAMDILIKVAKQAYRPDITTNNAIPNFFQKLITNCWSQDPQNRPTFDQIIQLLKESNIEINNLCKEEIENLTKDSSLLSSINHPYILKFIGYSSVNFDNIRKPVIITEYASNKTLEDLIDMEREGIIIEGWHDTKKLINIFGIAYCMSFLHSHDIIHYNLKPSNIIMDENCHPKICGFGFFKQNLIKKCLEMQSVYNPKENFLYETPEVLNSYKFTKESDVYSFAFIVYELITNEKPFNDTEQDTIDLLKKLKEDPTFRPKLDSTIPDCYPELIESCWSKDPQERPSFEKIVSILKKDQRFITSSNINKD